MGKHVHRVNTIKSKDGTIIHYEYRKGSSKVPLLLLHGLGGNSSSWKYLRGKPGVLIVDIRNHGRNSRDSTFNFSLCVEDVEAVLIQEKIKKIDLAGNCLGAIIAAEYQQKNPSMVRKMIFIAPWAREIHRGNLFFRIYARLMKLLLFWVPTKKEYPFIEFGDSRRNIPEFLFWWYDIQHVPLQLYIEMGKQIVDYTYPDIENTSALWTIYGKSDWLLKKHKLQGTCIVIEGNHVLAAQNATGLEKNIEKIWQK